MRTYRSSQIPGIQGRQKTELSNIRNNSRALSQLHSMYKSAKSFLFRFWYSCRTQAGTSRSFLFFLAAISLRSRCFAASLNRSSQCKGTRTSENIPKTSTDLQVFPFLSHDPVYPIVLAGPTLAGGALAICWGESRFCWGCRRVLLLDP